MTKQIRQTVTVWNEFTKEYQVKLFINGTYQKEADYFTNDITDASWTAIAMEEQPKLQGDFCKEELKKKKQSAKPTKPLATDWPIYSESGELMGWLNLAEKIELPKILCIQDQTYMQIKTPKILCD